MRIFQRKFFKLLLGLLLTLTYFLIPLQPTKASPLIDKSFPRLANYYLGWDIDQETTKELAKWDVIIISNAAHSRNPNLVPQLRKLNPDITILVYVVAQQASNFAPILEDGNFFKEQYEIVKKNDWFLYKNNKEVLPSWPNASWINLASTSKTVNGQQYTDWLAEAVNKKYLANNLFDGVFYDNIFDNITWADKQIDIDNDGRADDEGYINKKWREGVQHLLDRTNQLAPDKLIIANTNSNYYNKSLNGRLLEHFPKPEEGHWSGNLSRYLNNQLKDPQIFIINANNNNVDNPLYDLKKFRFAYTSTLLGDGFFSFSNGDASHDTTWWFDEYDIFLGKTQGQIENLLGLTTPIRKGVWRREFENGVIFVNSSNQPQTIDLGLTLEKIKGIQDPVINDGALVTKITLQPNDGIVLQKRIDEILDSPFLNGSFVKPFNKFGTQIQRNAFFVFDRQALGNNWVAKIDLDNDGQREKVIADQSKITIFNADSSVKTVIYPYGSNYQQGVNIDIDDIDGDGDLEIVTGTGKGAQPLVKVFDHLGQELNSGFFAYSSSYRGGVNVALADLNGNNKKDIVVGAGYLGGPQVRIFNTQGKLVSGGFFAYNKNFRGGVNVAAGDIDGDGIDEIITGAGYGGSTHVRMFNGKTQPLNPGFFAFSKTSRKGVKVFVADLDHDGIEEVLAANPNPF